MLPVKPLPQSIRLRNLWEVPMIRPLLSLAVVVVLATSYGAPPRAASVGPGVGNIPQGTQTDDSFKNSFAANDVANVFATTQQVSCYTPEVPFTVSDAPLDWYTGETPCNGAATTGEDLGPYATQQGSNAGFPATAPVLVSNEAVSVAVRPHGATSARQWITKHNGQPDILFATNAGFGQEPDKQWIAIDNNPTSPFYNTIYAKWVNFNGIGSKPSYSTAKALPGGTHTDWTTPLLLPVLDSKQNNTDLLPHVAPSGVVWTTVDQFPGKKGQCCVTHTVDFSTDGGLTWRGPLVISSMIQLPPFPGPGYSNTTFRDGIAVTFGVGRQLVAGHYPLYAAWEDFSTGFDNIILSASFDDGQSWTSPIQVNDNANLNTDEFQPNLATAADGTVSVNFYDRRLSCPAGGTTEAVAAGLSRDTVNPNYSGSLPPYSAANYCVNAAIQFYRADLT